MKNKMSWWNIGNSIETRGVWCVSIYKIVFIDKENRKWCARFVCLDWSHAPTFDTLSIYSKFLNVSTPFDLILSFFKQNSQRFYFQTNTHWMIQIHEKLTGLVLIAFWHSHNKNQINSLFSTNFYCCQHRIFRW